MFAGASRFSTILADVLPSPPMIPGTARELPPVWQILVSGLFLSIAVFLVAGVLYRSQRSRTSFILVWILAAICLSATIMTAGYIFQQSSAYHEQIQSRRNQIRLSH